MAYQLRQYNNRWFLLCNPVGNEQYPFNPDTIYNYALDRMDGTVEYIDEMQYIDTPVDIDARFNEIIGVTYKKDVPMQDIYFAVKPQSVNYVLIIERIKTYGLLVWRSQALKYAVVCIVGVLIVGFLDENSVWSHMKNRQRIDELTEEKARYNAAFQRDQAQIRDLERNPKAMERIARERYFMKADDEDIFVLREEEPSSIQTEENEKTE